MDGTYDNVLTSFIFIYPILRSAEPFGCTLSSIWQDVNQESVFFFSAIINRTAIFWSAHEDFVKDFGAAFPGVIPKSAPMQLGELLSLVDPIVNGKPKPGSPTEELSIIGELEVPCSWLPSRSIRRISALKAKWGGFYDYQDTVRIKNIEDVVVPNSRFIILKSIADG